MLSTKIADIITELYNKRKKILGLSPEKALNTILDSLNPVPLIHSFTEEDFYFLINEIGIEDSLPVISLASNRQWEYILDQEIWEKDRIKMGSASKWLKLLLNADQNRLTRWLYEEKKELIELFLFKNIRVIVREHDQDPSDFPEGYLTKDDVFYYKFAEPEYLDESDELTMEKRDEFLSRFMDKLAEYDYKKFQKLLIESGSIIPAETLEEMFRLRNVRLAEKGFLPFNEAVNVYKPLSPQSLKNQTGRYITRHHEPDYLMPSPLYHTNVLTKSSLFTSSLELVENDELLKELQTEFAGLCNRIIAADQKIIKNREELVDIVKKACGYLSIGLTRLHDMKKKTACKEYLDLIKKYPVGEIFRVGYSAAIELKWEAEKWFKQSWTNKEGLKLNFWGEEWLGVLGGLLIKNPLYYDNYKTGVLYREFETIEDIIETEKKYHAITAIDDILFTMKIELDEITEYDFFTYKKLILTLWARDYLGLPEKYAPVELSKFKKFFNLMFLPPEKTEKSTCRKTDTSMKESLLNWLSKKTGIENYELSKKIGGVFEDLFNEIENEYGRVDGKDLQPEYIHHFLISES